MSTRGTVEAFLRDKLGITSIVLLLVYDAMGDVSTLHSLLKLIALIGLAGYTLYEGHRHVERLGNPTKSTDLIREFSDHMKKELERVEKIESDEAALNIPIDIESNPWLKWLYDRTLELMKEESVELKTEEEKIPDNPEVI